MGLSLYLINFCLFPSTVLPFYLVWWFAIVLTWELDNSCTQENLGWESRGTILFKKKKKLCTSLNFTLIIIILLWLVNLVNFKMNVDVVRMGVSVHGMPTQFYLKISMHARFLKAGSLGRRAGWDTYGLWLFLYALFCRFMCISFVREYFWLSLNLNWIFPNFQVEHFLGIKRKGDSENTNSPKNPRTWSICGLSSVGDEANSSTVESKC